MADTIHTGRPKAYNICIWFVREKISFQTYNYNMRDSSEKENILASTPTSKWDRETVFVGRIPTNLLYPRKQGQLGESPP